MITIIVHVNSEEPIEGEVEELPESGANFVLLNNPRLRDGKDVHYLAEEVTSMIIPWHRINFIQIKPSGETEEVMSFVRR